MPKNGTFQSGEWTGFYTYSSWEGKHRMDLVLGFDRGRITGEGRDDIGDFAITGRYDSGSVECSWNKDYIGRHKVYYEGFGEGKSIWGTWSIRSCTGGFHIWPVGEGEGLTETIRQEEPIGRQKVRVGTNYDKVTT